MRLFPKWVMTIAVAVTVSTAAYADNWSKNWSVSGAAQLRVGVDDGFIKVSAGSGNQIEASVVTRGWKIGPGEVTITERQNGNRVELDVSVPRKRFSVGNVAREIRVELRVPHDISCALHSGDGAIELDGLHGKTEARTEDGSIEAINMEGSFEGRSGDGHLRLTGKLDMVDLETGDGSIEAELAGGSKISQGWRFQSGDGHVTLRVPQDLHANIDAHTNDGQVTIDMPFNTQTESEDHSEMRGKLNGGGGTLTIRTGDGGIRIERT